MPVLKCKPYHVWLVSPHKNEILNVILNLFFKYIKNTELLYYIPEVIS